MKPALDSYRTRRRGVVLLIVLAMLALFATVGLSFVFYAEAEALSSKYRRAAEVVMDSPNLPPERMLSFALGQIIYGTDLPTSKIKNLSMAETLYGRPGATVPFNGLGRDRSGTEKISTYQATDIDGANAPYTYPDDNTPFLAAMNKNGEILHRSYERKYKFDTMNNYHKYDTLGHITPQPPSPLPTGDWPKLGGDVRNVEMSAGVPDGGTTGVILQNDSFWIDVGFPIMVTKEGVYYKPMVAPFIIDLDNRVNLSVVASYFTKFGDGQLNQDYALKNSMPPDPYRYSSRHGLGPWEINPVHLWHEPTATTAVPQYTAMGNPNELNLLLRGSGGITPPNTATPRSRFGISPTDKPDTGVPANVFFQSPTSTVPPATTGTMPPVPAYWSRIPFHGLEVKIDPKKYDPMQTIMTMTGPQNPAYRAFADLPDAWLSAGTEHPCMFDYFSANVLATTGNPNQDVRLALSNTEAALRYGEKGSPAVTSDLFRQFTTSLNPNVANNRKVLNMLTTYSMGLDVPHLGPLGSLEYKLKKDTTNTDPAAVDDYLLYPKAENISISTTAGELNRYKQSTAAERLLGLAHNANAYTTIPAPNNIPGPSSRVNVSDPTGNTIYSADKFLERLRLITHGTTAPTYYVAADTEEYHANRWLAQLAANMFDFTDRDSAMTVYRWRRDPADTNPPCPTNPPTPPAGTVPFTPTAGFTASPWDVVFGVEQPQVTLSEVYATLDNDKNDKGLSDSDPYKRRATYARLNVWVELYNPTGNDVALNTYRVLVAKGRAADIKRNATGKPATILGTFPDPGAMPMATNWPAAPNNVILAGDRTVGPSGFYILGPAADNLLDMAPDDRKPSAAMLSQVDATDVAFSYQLPDFMPETDALGTPTGNYLEPAFVNDKATNSTSHAEKVFVVVQRLADPNRPENTTVDSVNYNPYVTVDYSEVEWKDSRVYNGYGKFDATQNNNNKAKGAAMTPETLAAAPALNTLAAQGRKQPLSHQAVEYQTPPPPMPMPPMPDLQLPKHTFKQQNNPNTASSTEAWAWFVHPDRLLVNKAELVNVSIVPPMSVTHEFPGTRGILLQAMLDKESLMGRVLEALHVPSFQYTSPTGATNPHPQIHTATSGPRPALHVPGRINLNTVWDKEVLLALFDPQFDQSNPSMTPEDKLVTRFKKEDVDAFFTELETHRNSKGGIAGFSDFRYTPTATPQLTLEDSFFKLLKNDSATPTPTGLFNNTTANKRPYEREEAFMKIANNITFTSNTFAVWMTLGFFEVDMTGSTPTVTQNELGKNVNLQVRHRMFAIVDRSQMLVPHTNRPITSLAAKGALVGANHKVTVQKSFDIITNPATVSWKLAKDMVIRLTGITPDPTTGVPQWEVVRIQNADVVNNSIEVKLTQPLLIADVEGATTAPNVMISFQPGIASANTYLRPYPSSTALMDYGHPGPQPNFNMTEYSYVVPYWRIID